MSDSVERKDRLLGDGQVYRENLCPKMGIQKHVRKNRASREPGSIWTRQLQHDVSPTGMDR